MSARFLRLLGRTLVLATLGGAALAFSSQLALKVPGFTPEVRHPAAGPGWMSVEWAQTSTVRTAGPYGPASDTFSPPEVRLFHATDNLSAAFFEAVTAKTHFNDIHLREYSDTNVLLREWVMEDAYVSEFQPSGSAAGSGESLTIFFGKLLFADPKPINAWFDFTNHTGGEFTTNTAPTVDVIANQTTGEDTPIDITLTIGDAESLAGLTLGATSSNGSLLPAASAFQFSGTGTSRNLRITPAANRSGSAIVTVTVTDGLLQATRTFTLTVSPVQDPPFIYTVPTQSTPTDTPLDVPFTVIDIDSTITTVTVSGSSSDQSILPNSGIAITGTENARSVHLTPAPNAYGTVTVTLIANDGTSDSQPCSFQLNVVPPPTDPTDITVTPNVVPENSAPGTVVGTLAAADINGGPHTFELLSPIGGPFQVSGTQLVVAPGASLDYETATSFILTLKATDDTARSYTGPVTVQIGNVNEAPALPGLPATSLAIVRGTTVALPAFTVSDPDATDLTVTLATPQGTLTVNTPVGVVVGGNNTGTVTLAGPIASLNAMLDGTHITLTASGNFPDSGPQNLSLSVQASDNGQSGAGGVMIANGSIPLRFYRHRIEQWRELHFTAAELADPALEATLWGNTADADGDGLNNVGEYAFDRDPRVADAELAPQPVIAPAPDTLRHLHLVVVVRNDDPELIVRFESGDSPATLSTATVELANSQVFAPGYDVRTLRDTIAVQDAPRRFIRAFVDLQYQP